MLPEKKIIDFVARHHVLTLATRSESGAPYCAACFYAYDKSANRIIFTTDDNTMHGKNMIADNRISCGINLETRVVGKVQGIQICGTVHSGEDADKMTYIKRFPYAAVAPLNILVIEPDFMKLTDNTLGFGKKLIWSRQE